MSNLSPSSTFFVCDFSHDTTTNYNNNINHTLLPNLSFFFILSFVKHQYHAKIDDQIDKALASMTQGLINKLVSVLEATLGKLARYDEGSLIGSLLSFTVIFGISFPLLQYQTTLFQCYRMCRDQARS